MLLTTRSDQTAFVVSLNFLSHTVWVKNSGAKTCSTWAWKFTSMYVEAPSLETFLLVLLFIACEFKRRMNVPVAHEFIRGRDGVWGGFPTLLSTRLSSHEPCASPQWSSDELDLAKELEQASPGKTCVNAVWSQSTQPFSPEDKWCVQNTVSYRNAVRTDHFLWNGVNSRLCCLPEETSSLYPLLSHF